MVGSFLNCLPGICGNPRKICEPVRQSVNWWVWPRPHKSSCPSQSVWLASSQSIKEASEYLQFTPLWMKQKGISLVTVSQFYWVTFTLESLEALSGLYVGTTAASQPETERELPAWWALWGQLTPVTPSCMTIALLDKVTSFAFLTVCSGPFNGGLSERETVSQTSCLSCVRLHSQL